jgi:hypothetical protein
MTDGGPDEQVHKDVVDKGQLSNFLFSCYQFPFSLVCQGHVIETSAVLALSRTGARVRTFVPALTSIRTSPAPPDPTRRPLGGSQQQHLIYLSIYF